MKIDILIPAYNEARSLPELIERIKASINKLKKTDPYIKNFNFEYHFYIADNKSTDNTIEVVNKLQSIYPGEITLIQNLRNYGYDQSTHNLFRLSRGDAAIHILSDLEDPPELVGKLIKLWLVAEESNYDSILAAKVSNDSELSYIRWGRKFFYILSRNFLRINIPSGYHGVGIYSNIVVKDAVWLFTKSSLNMRSCLASCSNSYSTIHYSKSIRRHGKSSMGLRRISSYSIESIFKQERFYHLFIGIMCLASIGFFMLCLSLAIINQLISNSYPSGVLTIAMLISSFAIITNVCIYLLSSQISSLPKARNGFKVRFNTIDK